jgi:hypothetical protein
LGKFISHGHIACHLQALPIDPWTEKVVQLFKRVSIAALSFCDDLVKIGAWGYGFPTFHLIPFLLLSICVMGMNENLLPASHTFVVLTRKKMGTE